MGLRTGLGRLLTWLSSGSRPVAPSPRAERRRAARERHRAGGEAWGANDRQPPETPEMPISESSYVDPRLFLNRD